MKDVVVRLTQKEAAMLAYAAGSIRDDLDDCIQEEQDKRAWVRAMAKLRLARQISQLPPGSSV